MLRIITGACCQVWPLIFEIHLRPRVYPVRELIVEAPRGAGAAEMPSPKGKHPQAVSAADGAAVQLRHLMRTIVTVTAANEQLRPAEGMASGPENVLVDTEFDGMRYLLIRMPGTEQNRSLLSPRELEVVRMVAQGHQNKTIAGILNISTWTVCAHVRRIFAKLGVSSRAAMVARLLQNDGRAKPSRATSANDLRAHSG